MAITEINSRQSSTVADSNVPAMRNDPSNRLAQVISSTQQPNEGQKGPGIWQQMKTKVKQCSRSVSDLAKRHEKCLKVIALTSVVVVLAGGILAIHKSASPATPNVTGSDDNRKMNPSGGSNGGKPDSATSHVTGSDKNEDLRAGSNGGKPDSATSHVTGSDGNRKKDPGSNRIKPDFRSTSISTNKVLSKFIELINKAQKKLDETTVSKEKIWEITKQNRSSIVLYGIIGLAMFYFNSKRRNSQGKLNRIEKMEKRKKVLGPTLEAALLETRFSKEERFNLWNLLFPFWKRPS